LTRLPRFLTDCQAASLPVQGRIYTWKKRLHGHLVYEKLDRAIGRHDWQSQYPQSSVSAGPFTCSDHSYILMDTDPGSRTPRKSLFRYQPNWSAYQEVQRLVRHNWQEHTKRVPMFRFTRKLRSIKSGLKRWSQVKFMHFRTQLEKNTDQLQLVESKIVLEPNSHRLHAWYLRLLKQREKLLLFSKCYWGTLARKKWLVDGDRSSRYFHQIAQGRKRNCAIIRIKDPSGIWLDEPHVIQQRFLHDYMQRFTSDRESLAPMNDHLTFPIVTAEENAELVKPVTDTEIYDAVFQMDPHKAP